MKKISSIYSVVFVLLCCYANLVNAASPTSATVAGTLQSELGCSADWMPACASTHLIKNGTDWSATFTLPAGTWEYKIALNDAWTESYGYNQGSANAIFTLAAEKAVTFHYDEVTHAVTDNALDGVVVVEDPQPSAVTVAGDLQQALGCTANWDPSCADAQLEFDSANKIWRKTFVMPAGTWAYKAALDNGWTENYGANGVSGGGNISFTSSADQAVTFFYSHKTHWITNNVNSVVATAVGDYQAALGCSENWAPSCLLTWLQDLDGDGLYTYSTTQLPVGSYSTKVAINEGWDESYGNDEGGNVSFTVASAGQKIVITYDAVNHKVYAGDALVAGNLHKAKAYWLAADTIALDLSAEAAAAAVVKLHHSADASLTTSPAGVAGGDAITLSYDPAGLSEAIKTKYRHLKNLAAFKIAEGDLANARTFLKQQLAVSATNAQGNLLEATGVQFAGALDELFNYTGDLGVVYSGEVPSVKLWAPTATAVTLHVYADAEAATEPSSVTMVQDATSGVWSVTGDASWNRKYYLFEVQVFVRETGAIEHNWVADPYSLNTSINSKRSQFVNLNDADLKPESWDELSKPAFSAPEDMVIYELHVRDFSIADSSVPEAERGTFMAFTETESAGMTHLKNLAEAGVTHIHLLPAFDCATINEDKTAQATITDDLSAYDADSEAQQAAVNAIRGQDGFNWCYDPYQYTVPEGSYATDANGVARIIEFRKMVAALNAAGLRVVMDVVYNHTSGSLLGDTSILDKVVPDYYHRLDEEGNIENSTCCANTASENTMMEKLMRDSIKIWATQYKVDGFRFDIMGHHTKDNIINIQNDIHALTPETDGVDGSSIYFYGEGWNFGEVQDNARFTQASIGNMSGTGVGTFNNFIRDAVRGGGPFDSGIQHVQNQSFINGLYLDPNAENVANADAKAALLHDEDILRSSLAGSLADYSFIDSTGTSVMAASLNGAGYTQDPQETINYIAAHDNETLFDSIQYKAPIATSMAERVRMQVLGNSLVLFAQGIPFLHAGQEMLRSKSTDRNSYDSGDWFNALDFTYSENGWGKGLPLSGDNQQNWTVVQPLLANADLKPASADIIKARDMTLELIKLRKSSKLFRLQTAAEIQQQVKFYNTGAAQEPGIIAMGIMDSDANLDPNAEMLMVIFNANTSAKTIILDALKGVDFALNSIQQNSVDASVKTAAVDNATGAFSVPARTTAVFVATQKPVVSSSSSSAVSSVASSSSSSSKSKGGGAFGSLIDLLLAIGLLFALIRSRNARA